MKVELLSHVQLLAMDCSLPGSSSMGFSRQEYWSEVPLPSPTTISSVQFSSFTQSCPTLCDPMNRSTPGLPVHHQLPEFTQTHVHQVRDAIQSSHPGSSPSPPAPIPNISHSVVSNSLQPHEFQHARPPCPSPTPRIHSDSHPSSR